MVLCSSHGDHDAHPPEALNPLSGRPLKPFRLVCRNRRQFGSHAAMNVSRRPSVLREDTLPQMRPTGSTGAEAWHRGGVALFDGLSVMINPQGSRYGAVVPG
jgi:hypothetical protein